MSSRFRAASAAMLLLALAACDREERQSRGAPLPEGPPLAAGTDPRAKDYENTAYHVAQGQRLYAWMNCVGCHAHGGGGMGPPLMDSQWRYGGSMEDIVRTISSMAGRTECPRSTRS
jgi:cytochrome c oxidase cbb3-type subunit 3